MNKGRKLILVGGGGHCKSVLDAAERMDTFEEIVITDPDLSPGSKVLGHEVTGNDGCLPELFSSGFEEAFITVGSIKSTALRRKLYEKLKKTGFRFPNIIDPSATVSEHAILRHGIFIGKSAVVNADAEIENFAIINSGAIIEHECKVGAFTHVAVGTVLCGQVIVGDDCLIGAGSTIIQGKYIGNNAIVGAGSLVIRDIHSDTLCHGLVK